MKHKAKLLVLMMVTACSTESKTEGGLPSAAQVLENVQAENTADAKGSGEGEEIASAETIATPVETGGDPTPAPPVTPPETIAEEKISPPNQVTGAYLTATLLPRAEESDPLRVGLMARMEDERITEDDGRYRLNWQLTFSQTLDKPVKLVRSEERAFDQVIEFYGTAAEFQELAGSINVYLQVSETGTTLNSLVNESLSDLVAGQEIPEPTLTDPVEETGGEVETPEEPVPEDPILTDVETKPEQPAPVEEEAPVVTEVEGGPKNEPLASGDPGTNL